MYRFESPLFFALFLPLIYVFFRNYEKKSISIPSISSNYTSNKLQFKFIIGKLLIFTALSMVLIALARPVKVERYNKITKDGIDIVLIFDISLSMMAEDIKPNRLIATKKVMKNFVNERRNDRIGLVAFAGNAYTRVPLTFDHDVILENIEYLSVEDISVNNATAIGLGIASGINRLKDSRAENKVIILLTDGENNAGDISPINAGRIAKNMGIKVYTVGVAGEYSYINSLFGSRKVKNREIDEETLIEISNMTGGEYYRAIDANSLQAVFNSIDELEKTEIEAREIQIPIELYRYFLIPSIFLLLIGYYLNKYRYLIVP